MTRTIVALLVFVAAPFLTSTAEESRADDSHAGHDHEHERAAGAAADGETDGAADDVGHASRARRVWRGFVKYLWAQKQQELLPERVRSVEALEEPLDPDAEAFLRLDMSDPIRGILFRASGALVDLDALFSRGSGVSGSGASGSRVSLSEGVRKQADKLTAELLTSDNPYLEAYGQYYQARLGLEAGEYDESLKTLQTLMRSPRFLPRGEAQRLVVDAYYAKGEETLAILELQLYLASLPPAEESERQWGLEKLRKIRESHPGPMHDSASRMRSISTLLAKNDVGSPTQERQLQVEQVLEKIVDLLEGPALRPMRPLEVPGLRP